MTPAALARLHNQAFVDQRPWSATEFESLLASPHTVLSTHKQGFGLIRVIAGEAELLTLAVAPDAQGQGLGRSLLQQLMAKASRAGAAEIFLEVAADNARALKLYRSSGFAETGRRPGYYAAPDGTRKDAILMRAQLPVQTPLN